MQIASLSYALPQSSPFVRIYQQKEAHMALHNHPHQFGRFYFLSVVPPWMFCTTFDSLPRKSHLCKYSCAELVKSSVLTSRLCDCLPLFPSSLGYTSCLSNSVKAYNYTCTYFVLQNFMENIPWKTHIMALTRAQGWLKLRTISYCLTRVIMAIQLQTSMDKSTNKALNYLQTPTKTINDATETKASSL